MNYLNRLFCLGLVLCLAGCNATHTAINKRHLDVQTRMSASIFLDPVTPDKKTIFLQIRNTSDKPELDLQDPIQTALIEKGYQITDVLSDAHYILQANVLEVGRSDLRLAQHALNQGFGAALGGAVTGALVGSVVSSKDNDKAVVAGGLMGATVATVTDAMVQDVVYTVVADVQISEHMGNSVAIKEKTKSTLKQGTRGIREITSTEKIEWKRYQTRVVSTANKVNLKFKQALPELIDGLTHSITGVF